jgi:hypothetical protein
MSWQILFLSVFPAWIPLDQELAEPNKVEPLLLFYIPFKSHATLPDADTVSLSHQGYQG